MTAETPQGHKRRSEEGKKDKERERAVRQEREQEGRERGMFTDAYKSTEGLCYRWRPSNL